MLKQSSTRLATVPPTRTHARTRPLRLVVRVATATAAQEKKMSEIKPGNTRVGWVGTGVMGASMAGHIMSAGYSLTAFNRTVAKTDALKANGADIALSPKQVRGGALHVPVVRVNGCARWPSSVSVRSRTQTAGGGIEYTRWLSSRT
jgi:hypothetical protein